MGTPPHDDRLIGHLVDERYRVRARIARGGMATVYVATDLRLERRVALKVMHDHLSDDSVFQSKFLQEARAAARLSDPNVVNVFDQGHDDDIAYLVMEYLPGQTLRDLLKAKRRLSVPETISIMDAVLSGLAAAHRSGIIHRDVKPENVLIDERGRIKIGDFGLARASTAHTASGQLLLGTIAYLAPELVTRGNADARSDIYALGIMLYEMLTGEQPYTGEQPMHIAYQHTNDSVPRPGIKNPDIPEELDELVLWATERDPEQRPRDAQEMLNRLRAIERDLDIAPVAATTTVDNAAYATATLDSGDLTKKIAPERAPVKPDNNTKTLRKFGKRSKNRFITLLIVFLVLAGAAGGTGWWFGSGPGSKISVSDVVGLEYTDAVTTLESQSLSPSRSDQFSSTVDAGLVISTDPGPGTAVDRDSSVTLFVSKGPASHDLPAMAGQNSATVISTLKGANLHVVAPEEQFSDAPKGTVLSVTIAPENGDPIDCSKGCTATEGDSATVLVSAGPFPAVQGLSITDATTSLSNAGLLVSSEPKKEYSESIADGKVIGTVPNAGGAPWKPGDTVTLIVSQGPQLFPVPNVVGLSRDAAKRALTDAGFVASYNKNWDLFPDEKTQVISENPAAESQRVKGTTITLVITGSF